MDRKSHHNIACILRDLGIDEFEIRNVPQRNLKFPLRIVSIKWDPVIHPKIKTILGNMPIGYGLEVIFENEESDAIWLPRRRSPRDLI